VGGSFVRHDPAARHDLQAPLGQELPDDAPLCRVRAATVHNKCLKRVPGYRVMVTPQYRHIERVCLAVTLSTGIKEMLVRT
jgi:hypothetical protein